MENLSHSRQPNKSSATLSKRVCNGSNFVSKTTYDDVFGGPPKLGAPTLAPRVEDYSEIFGGFHASRAASIPVLDLPLVEEEDVFFDVSSSSFDYDQVFGNLDGVDFAVPFEELLMDQSNGGDEDADSSEEAWTPAETGSPSEESDHSGKNKSMSNGDSYEAIDDSMEFNVSYYKANQSSGEYMSNGITHVSQLHAVPGYTFLVDKTTPLERTYKEDPLLLVTDDNNLHIDFSGGMTREKSLRKTLSQPSNGSAGEQIFENGIKAQRGYDRNISLPKQAFVTISEISLRTQPSEVPPPCRPAPLLDVRKGDSGRLDINCKTSSSEGTMGDTSPPFFDVEVDASSSAAASAAAMKEAMQKAQAKLKSAKELLERKREGGQNHKSARKEKEGKTHKIVDSGHVKDEKVHGTFERQDSGMKFSITEEIQKVTKTTKAAPDSLEGEKLFSADETLAEKHGRTDKIDGADEWKEANQYFELVRMDRSRKSFEQTNNDVILVPDTKIHKHGQKEKKGAMEAVVQQQENEKIIKANSEDPEPRENEKLKIAREACEQQENNGRLGASRATHRHKGQYKEALEQADNDNRPKEALKREENCNKWKEACEREESEKRLRDALEHSENEKRLKEESEKKQREAFEQEENERRLKEAREREANEKRQREALEKEEYERKQKVAREREEAEKRLQKAREKEETRKRLEAFELEANCKTFKEAQEREKREMRSKGAFEKEESGNMLKESRVETEKRHKDAGEIKDRNGLNKAHEQTRWDEIGKKLKMAEGPHAQMEREDFKVLNESCMLDDDVNVKVNRLAGQHKEVRGAFAHEENGKIQTESRDGEIKMEAVEIVNVLLDGNFEVLGMAQGNVQHAEVRSKLNKVTELHCRDYSVKTIGESGAVGGQEKTKSASQMDSDTKVHRKKSAEEWGDRENNTKQAQVGLNQKHIKDKSMSTQVVKEYVQNGRKMEAAQPSAWEGKGNTQKTAQRVNASRSAEMKEKNFNATLNLEESESERMKWERELEMERLRKIEEEREREREREKDRMAVDLATLEARERAERAALDRATADARQRVLTEARERLEKACSEARERSFAEKASIEARHRAERAAVERATTEARERAVERAMAERAAFEARDRVERSFSDKFSASSRNNVMRPSSSSSESHDQKFQSTGSYGSSRYAYSSVYGAPRNTERSEGVEGESPQRCKARLERHRRTAERAAKALAEKNMRDLLAQREQAERNRLAETLDADVKRWSSGKEGNLRALLSTLQYILGPDYGWHPVPLTEVITSAAVKKAYRKATLCVHPDKLQQRGASIQQKYICEKVFDLLKEAWNKFNSEER